MHRVSLASLIILIMVFLTVPAHSQEEKDGDWPPRKNGFGIAMLFGPEATGGGPGYVWWDLGGKAGRRLNVYTVFADTDYRTYYVNYTEPGLIKPGERIDLTFFYQKRTGTHYFGIGPDQDMEDAAYYQRENYIGKFRYTLPLFWKIGITATAAYDRVVPRESTLHGREDFNDRYPELDRRLEDVYPALLDSREWRDEMNHYWGVTLWYLDIEGRWNFPVKGVYLSGTVSRIDATMGAEWAYWKYRAVAAWFFPVGDEYNIIGTRVRWDRLDGEEVPWYKLPTLGQARFSTGYVTDTNAMRGVWENEWADRNRFLATAEYRHRAKVGWYPESWRAVEWPFGFDPERFLRNMAWFGWVDAGQVWPDDGGLTTDMRWAYGIGNVLYFDSGLNQQVTIGFGPELSAYMLFSYGLQF